MAFAMDFTTAGERVTKSFCKKHNKIYVPVSLSNEMNSTRLQSIITFIDNSIYARKLDNGLCLNIAGNGLYTLEKEQKFYDEWMELFIWALTRWAVDKFIIVSACSGGQTGIDEAGAKATDHWKIPTIIRAPKKWLFRGKNGEDIDDEILFKKRFLNN